LSQPSSPALGSKFESMAYLQISHLYVEEMGERMRENERGGERRREEERE